MLAIYHIEHRRSDRVVWLMEELGLPYELIFTPGDIAGSSAAIKAVHPIGAAPTVRDGDTWICESGAILEYIIARHGGGRFGLAPDHPEFAAYLQWLHFAEGFAMDRLLGELVLRPLLDKVDPGLSPMARLYEGGGERTLNFAEAALEGRPYFAGEDFTAADIMMHLPIRAASGRYSREEYPRANAWLDRVEARPAFARMKARALPNGPLPGSDAPRAKSTGAAA